MPREPTSSSSFSLYLLYNYTLVTSRLRIFCHFYNACNISFRFAIFFKSNCTFIFYRVTFCYSAGRPIRYGHSVCACLSRVWIVSKWLHGSSWVRLVFRLSSTSPTHWLYLGCYKLCFPVWEGYLSAEFINRINTLLRKRASTVIPLNCYSYRICSNKWLCYGRGTARRAVSRNYATTKHPIWKLEFQVYRVALFAWSYV